MCTDNTCEETGSAHDPDWDNIFCDGKYIEVRCKDCGQSATVGTTDKLGVGLEWD